MKERGILFSAPMVLALLAGEKTQTRRALKPQPVRFIDNLGDCETLVLGTEPGTTVTLRCPYGYPGDRLWVRETWRTFERPKDAVDGVVYRADSAFHEIKNSIAAADAWVEAHDNGRHGDDWRPSIFMPRWASRITLEIEDVRVERLNAISEVDAKAEGAAHRISPGGDLAGAFEHDATPIGYRNHYRDIWESINGAGSWSKSPWVWVLTFKRLEVANG